MGLGIVRRAAPDGPLRDRDRRPGRARASRSRKLLPRRAGRSTRRTARAHRRSELARHAAGDPVEEMRSRTRSCCARSRSSRAPATSWPQLNRELEDTNRGVVALYAELDERAEHLRRADELKTRFLSNMSHEFRTPLNSILALARLLLERTDGELTPEQQTQVQFIRKSAEELTELVNDLLDLAQGRGRQDDRLRRSSSRSTDLFGALRGMLRPLLVGDAVDAGLRGCRRAAAARTPTRRRSRRSCATSSRTRSSSPTRRGPRPAAARSDPTATPWRSRCATPASASPRKTRSDLRGVRAGRRPAPAQVKGTGLGLPLSKKLGGTARRQDRGRERARAGSVFSLTIPRVLSGPGRWRHW